MRRKILASFLALAISGFPIHTASSQDTAAPAAPAKLVIDASVDTNSRSIRLSPLGISVPIPQNVAVSSFQKQPDWISLETRASGSLLAAEFRFSLVDSSFNCDGYQPGKKKKALKNAAAILDPRWVGYQSDSGWASLCLKTPQGTVSMEAGPLLGNPQYDGIRQLSANMADALMPESKQAAPPAPQVISIDDVLPNHVASSVDMCAMDPQRFWASCMLVENFRQNQAGCSGGNAIYCGVIAGTAAKSKPPDWYAAARYYRRACQLGDTASCKKADAAEKKDK